MASSIYKALDTHRQEIRLLVILPATDHTAPIECNLREVSLEENPVYTALSYTWGDPNVTNPVFVDGVECQVTTNLESALRHIRGEVAEVVLWADAICINQTDMLERNYQVQLMRRIYSNVDVRVWLGDEGDDSDEAMELIDTWGLELKERLSKEITTKDLDGYFDPEAWHSIDCLLGRAWWTRLWTVQEVVLPRKVTVICGRKALSWDSFSQWVSTWALLERSPILRSAGPSYLSKLALTKTRIAGLAWKEGLRGRYQKKLPPKTLLDLLWAFRNFEASNPFDKVYALLGLAADASDFMEPDYTQSISMMYTNLAHTIIQRDGTLDVLHNSGGNCLSATEPFDLPSWVPNWKSTQSKLGINPEKYCATIQTKEMIGLSLESPRNLFVHGILHGRVSSIEPPGFIEPSRTHQMPLILRTWTHDESSINPSGIPRLQEFFRTILLDCDIIDGERLSLDKEPFYDSLAAFIYNWMQDYAYWDPSSDFAKLMYYIDTRAKDADFEPFIGSQHKWLGEVDITKRGAMHCVGLVRQFSNLEKMSFILTEKEYMGLAPCVVQEGDIVCVLLGYSVPVILRLVGDHYLFVGDCFAYGLMDGEALLDFAEGKAVLQEFTIQ
jgi:Heterokaryon incompatibility protein (HET)